MMKKEKFEYIDILENLLDYNTDFFKLDMCKTLVYYIINLLALSFQVTKISTTFLSLMIVHQNLMT